MEDKDRLHVDPAEPMGKRNPFCPESDAPEGYYPKVNEYYARMSRALLHFIERVAYDKDAPPEVVRALPGAAQVLHDLLV